MRKVSLLIAMTLMIGVMHAQAETKEVLESTAVPVSEVAAPIATDVSGGMSSEQAMPPLITPSTPLPTKAERPIEGSSSDDIKQLIMGLISVIILIFILYFFVKKIPGMKVLGNPHMKVISVMNVGVKEKIALIQVGERVFLLGITAHNISYLHEFVTADVLFSQTQSADVNVTFQKMMQKIFERRPS